MVQEVEAFFAVREEQTEGEHAQLCPQDAGPFCVMGLVSEGRNQLHQKPRKLLRRDDAPCEHHCVLICRYATLGYFPHPGC